MRIQLWSYNYDPEPTGIGPMSRVWADGLRDLGHDVDVVAAHPHYPVPIWGRRILPYRETRGGTRVLRLPLWVGRATSTERYRQELTYMAAQFAALPILRSPDVLVSGSPSFPALLPAMVNTRIRRVPWVLWLHDILPDAATATGLVDEGLVLKASRWLERTAYAAAGAIVVPSTPFAENLRGKGVPADKIRVIGYPATRAPQPAGAGVDRSPTPRLLTMGNIGHSQGLATLVRAFEANPAGCESVRFVITGEGVAAADVRAEIRSGRVEMVGLLDDEHLEAELHRATIAVVSQNHTGGEFNIPSKMMNFMAYGLPVLAAVDPRGEVARIVDRSRAGWVVDSRRPESFPAAVAKAIADPAEIARRGLAAEIYARDNFSRAAFARRFDEVLGEAAGARRPGGPG
ncbi:MAG TPA: glycosyltransferase family 4 protein [Solirubrobacteraceae bacterium]|nr:glycosyltransferase family 4 protein [Solirubrobacteraceae bacterium]